MPILEDDQLTRSDLVEPEGRYARFFARVPVGLYRNAPDGRILDANPFLATILGYPSREALLTVNAHDIYVDLEDRRRQQDLLSSDGVVRGYRMRLRRADGSVIWVEDNCYLIREPVGGVLCHEGSLQDITEQVRIQNRLTAFNKCFLDFGSDPVANINRLTALCGDLLGADSALYDRLDNGLLCTMAQWHTPLSHNPVCDPQGRVCTDVILGVLGPTVVLRDLQNTAYAKSDPIVRGLGLRTFVGQTVNAADGCLGSLSALSRRDFVPTDGDLGMLKTIAVAIGIEEKRRTAEATTSRQARQMAALYETSLEFGAQRDVSALLSAVVVRAATLVGAPMGGLYLSDPEGATLELVVNHELPPVYAIGSRVRMGEGVAGRVAESGESLMVEDFAAWPGKTDTYRDSPLRRVLGVPLRVGAGVLGVLLVADDQQAGPFTDDDIRLAALFADQAAIALENTRLYAAAQRELAERYRVEQALRESEERYRRLFEDSPISLWDEDFSALKRRLNDLRGEGVTDLEAYFSAHPEEVVRCASLVTIADVNRSTMELYGARSKEQLVGALSRLMDKETLGLFVDELTALGSGRMFFEGEAVNRTLSGSRIYVAIRVTVAPGHEADWSKVIVSIVDITQQKRAEDRLRFLSSHDVLTGLYNLAFFEEEAARLERGRGYPISVLMVDVDGLKLTNDRRGHAAGDSLLRRASTVLRSAFRTEDVVARIGGDEFAVLLPAVDVEAAAEAVARVRAALLAHNRDRDGVPLQLSLGVATAEKGTGLAAAIKTADASMYAEKEVHRREGNGAPVPVDPVENLSY